MTDTEPTTRPIHERWGTLPMIDGLADVLFDRQPIDMRVCGEEVPAFRELIAAAGKTHAVLVDLPDCAGGGQLATWSYPNGAVEASWRQSAHHTWVPVEQLTDGAVCVAP